MSYFNSYIFSKLFLLLKLRQYKYFRGINFSYEIILECDNSSSFFFENNYNAKD